MREIRTEIEIEASAQKVWAILTDFARHDSWNPFMKNVRGMLRENEHVQFYVLPPGGQRRDFKPKVLTVVENKGIRWADVILFPAFFYAEHYFELVSQGANKTLFRQGELFKGILVNFIWSTLDRDARAGFVAMNQAIKTQAETKRSEI